MLSQSINPRCSIGPHGVDTSLPRGITRTRIIGKSTKVAVELAQFVAGEAAKQSVNAGRAASRRRASEQ
jgi:hypothetical protein